jgi:hypothetical protein
MGAASNWGFVAEVVGSRSAKACKTRVTYSKQSDGDRTVSVLDRTRVHEYIACGRPLSTGGAAWHSPPVQVSFADKAEVYSEVFAGNLTKIMNRTR